MTSGQRCQSGVDVLNFHKIADCNELFSNSQMCDLDFVWSRPLPCFSPYKFLWVRLGMLSVICFSPSLRLPVPLPGPMAPSFKHSATTSHREGKFFIGVMKIRPPRNPNFAELGPGRPEISRQASNPSTPALPTSPAPRNGWRASRRRPEAERLVAHLQVILSSPSRAPSEWQNGRLAQCPPRRRLQLGRVGEGRPSIQEGARIKRHGKLKDASSGSHDEIL